MKATLIRLDMKPVVLASVSDAIRCINEASNKADWSKVKESAEHLAKLAEMLAED